MRRTRLQRDFINEDGRHARLATDLMLVALDHPRFSCRRVNLVDASDTRLAYVAVLRAGDNYDIGPLLEFVRS